jgi:zinc protease
LTYEGKALGSGFDYNPLVDTGFGYAWAAFPPGGDVKATERELKAAVEKAVSGIPADLVTGQKRKALLDNALSRNSVSGLAQAWTDAIALEGISSPEVGMRRLQRVGPAAVDKAARVYLDLDHAVTLELTPTPGAHPRSGGRIFGTPESFSSSPSKAVALPGWAAAVLANLPSPKPLFHPADYHLPNGLRVIVQPIVHSTSVSLFGTVHTNENLQAAKGREGVGSLLDGLYEWGPAGMTRSEFEAKMDAIGAEYSVGSDFSLQVLPQYLSAGVELLAKDLLNPALPRRAFESQQRIFARELAGRLSSPLFKFGRAVATSLLPKGDPALRIPTPESVRSLTLADVNTYEAKVMRPDETTIVVMGDVKSDAVKSLIAKYFGGWQAHGPKSDLVYKPVVLSRPTQVFVPDGFRRQDAVILAETLDSSYNDPGHYAVALGNGFLGGALFASPLYRELRVKRGLVYYVGSSAGFSRTRGSFRIDFGAYPNKVEEAKQLAIEQLRVMADRPLTPDELHLAKASALRKIELTNQSVGDLAGSWLFYSREGLSLDRLYLVARHFERLTAAEIRAAFKKYVDPSRLSTFVLGKPVGK